MQFWIAGDSGACIVEQEPLGHDKLTYSALLKKAWELKCNPGGQVSIYGNFSRKFPDKWMNRLLTADDIAELDKEMQNDTTTS